MTKKTRLKARFEKLVASVKGMKLKSERLEDVERERLSATSDGSNTEFDAMNDEMDEDMGSSSFEQDILSGDDEQDIPDEPIRTVRLRHSRFPNRPSTIVFDYPNKIKVNPREEHPHRTETVAVDKLVSSKSDERSNNSDLQIRLQYKTHWERISIKSAFKKAGFERTKGSKWSALWGKHLKKRKYKKLKSYQRVNHFPDSWVIGNKSRLMRCIQGMQRQFGAPYQFIPEGYSWPDQKDEFMQVVEREPSSLWILKPPSSSCGKGIRVIRPQEVETIDPEKKWILHRYIANPLLIDGYKFDMRIYVLVTSIYPLRIYLFQEGLVRFCTAKYSLKPEDLENRYSHLTNYSVNSKSAAFNNDAQDGQGSKWSLNALYDRLDAEGITKDAASEITAPIEDIVIKTLIGAEGHITPLFHQHVPHRNNCYELFGFDFMLDADLKPWLIEVNISPSLMSSSPLDRRIKGTLVSDVFNLVGFQMPITGGDKTSMCNAEAESSEKLLPWKSTSNTEDQVFFDFQQTKQLSDSAWEIILDYEEEVERAGHFKCIFPTSETLNKYQHFFTAPRHQNTLCGRWLQYKKKRKPPPAPSKFAPNSASIWKSAIPRPSPIKKVASANMAVSWKSMIPRPSPIKKVSSAPAKLLGEFNTKSSSKRKLAFAIPFTPFLLPS